MNIFTSIIIPTYNEELKIKNTLDAIKNETLINEIIVVDDGSTDKTVEILKQYNDSKIKYFIMKKNGGKGKALEEGLKQISVNSKVVVFLDGDLGSTSKEVIKIIKPVINGETDVAIAKFKPATKKGGMGFVKRLAKNSVYELTGVKLDSTISGQRAFKREVIEKLGKIPDGYGVEVGMTIDMIKMGYKVIEVLVDMGHNETGRNISGFIHRGKQYLHIRKIVNKKKKEWK